MARPSLTDLEPAARDAVMQFWRDTTLDTIDASRIQMEQWIAYFRQVGEEILLKATANRWKTPLSILSHVCSMQDILVDMIVEKCGGKEDISGSARTLDEFVEQFELANKRFVEVVNAETDITRMVYFWFPTPDVWYRARAYMHYQFVFEHALQHRGHIDFIFTELGHKLPVNPTFELLLSPSAGTNILGDRVLLPRGAGSSAVVPPDDVRRRLLGQVPTEDRATTNPQRASSGQAGEREPTTVAPLDPQIKPTTLRR